MQPAAIFVIEVPGGFEPPMSDLQSDALATWPRRHSLAEDPTQVRISYGCPESAHLVENRLSLSNCNNFYRSSKLGKPDRSRRSSRAAQHE